MFMPINSIVVEICPGIDGRMLPLSGPFSRLAMATGNHHIMYHLNKNTMQFSKHGSTFNINNFLNWLDNKLKMFE